MDRVRLQGGGGGTVLDGGVGGVLFPSSGPTALNTRAKNVLPARRGGWGWDI